MSSVLGHAGLLMKSGLLYSRDFNDLSTANLSGFGTGVTMSASDGRLQISSSTTNNAVRARLDDASTYQDFTAEFDAWAPTTTSESNGNPNGGLLYRTTSWVAANDTFGYLVAFGRTGVGLGRGSNSGAGAYTSIATYTAAFSAAQQVRIKVSVVGSLHKVWVDGVLRISATDATHSAAGNIGFNRYKGSGGDNGMYFDNVTVRLVS